ncbi:hypothetical protein R4Z09_21555 [Niallia oryzisoli]|uniref:Uncharacterized protein n=1 Tax=Niallia oryzisoli TaxID=1737571 RepID=A0ABZ2CD16_9BACI
MKSQRIPEHKLNYTTTVDQALDNMESKPVSNPLTTGNSKTSEAATAHANEVK